MSTLPRSRRLAARLRHYLMVYVAAAAINVELVSGMPIPEARATVAPITSLQRRPLVDGAWDERELLPGSPRRVVVYELLPSETAPARGEYVFSTN